MAKAPEKGAPKAPEKGAAKAAEETTEAPKKGGKKLIVIIAVLVVLLAGGGGGAWWFMGHNKAATNAGKAAEKAEAPPVFEALEQFTVNLKDQGAVLQVNISLKVKDTKLQEEVKQHSPEIRNVILLLLSNKESTELATIEGKKQLGNEIKTEVNKILGVKKPEDGVSNVLFTSFIIQVQ